MKRGQKSEGRTFNEFVEAVEGIDQVKVVHFSQGFTGGKHRPEVGVVMANNIHDHLVHVEKKEDEGISLLAAFKQACEDSKPGSIPIAVVKYPKGPSIAVIYTHETSATTRAWLQEQFKET